MGNVTRLMSIKEMIAHLISNKDFGNKFNEDILITWIANALRHIGSYGQLIMKEEILTVENHQTLLPCDCYKVRDLYVWIGPIYNQTVLDHNVVTSADTVYLYKKKIEELQARIEASSDIDEIKQLSALIAETELVINNQVPKRISSEFNIATQYTFTNENLVSTNNINSSRDIKVEFDKITTGFSTGYIRLLYLAIPTDEEGFPMIPDDPSYIEAIDWYVDYMLERKRVPRDLNLLTFSSRMWNRYCLQARTSINMPSLKEMQEMANTWNRWMPDNNDYYSNFENLGKRQIQLNH